MAATVGQKAPEFQLVDQDKNTVTLSSLKGKNVILLFFPAAFTSVCTKEMCQTRDELSFYNGMDAHVFGISVDMPFTLAKYKADNNLNFPMLSDFNKEASTAYGCLYENWILGLKGVSKRSSFVIDKEGVVRFAQILENANDYPDFEGIKKTLESLK
jgi:glutaredoxin-dependent peroxiredoxin